MSKSYDNALGALPISIATSIAFEYLLGIQSEANPDPVPSRINQYQELWINIRTLVRNYIGSLDAMSAKSILADSVFDYIIAEMGIITGIIRDYGSGQVVPIFYTSDYTKYHSNHFNMGSPRRPKTPNQIHADLLMNNSVKLLFNNKDIKITKYRNYLTPQNRVKTLILTHIPYDLLSYRSFGKLELLESHTGSIKNRTQWYTKYQDGKNLPMLPFLECLLPVFGDNVFFYPLNRKARTDVLEIASKYKWDPLTTEEKVLYGVAQLRNQYLQDAIKSFR